MKKFTRAESFEPVKADEVKLIKEATIFDVSAIRDPLPGQDFRTVDSDES